MNFSSKSVYVQNVSSLYAFHYKGLTFPSFSVLHIPFLCLSLSFLHMQTASTAHYPPVRQVREALEGTAIHLAQLSQHLFKLPLPLAHRSIYRSGLHLPLSLCCRCCRRRHRRLTPGSRCQGLQGGMPAGGGCERHKSERPNVVVHLSLSLSRSLSFFVSLKHIPSQHQGVWTCQTDGFTLNQHSNQILF